MQVFKFGGASVNSAEAVKNMASIVRRYYGPKLVVVVSAMGKTTNKLEQLVPGVISSADSRRQHLDELKDYHYTMVRSLFADDPQNAIFPRLDELFLQLQHQTERHPSNYNFDYDQTVSFGEIISTTIISHYLNHIGLANEWLDIRALLRTDNHYREGQVVWGITETNMRHMPDSPLVVTQGFIAGTSDGHTTTLGREGSDYSAAILSYCLNAESMTIWKDVPGFLNADPKFFANTVKIEQIPYNEAIELAYYGASVIHPKTVKPIQNKGIPLHIKSFLDPEKEGSAIGPFRTIKPRTPLYIFKNDQVLLSILPKDFSFIAEDNLQTIFAALAKTGIRVNLMQNSALSFSLCVDNNPILLKQLREELAHSFRLRYNEGLQLITIRYYTQEIIDSIVAGRPILLQQRSRTTTQLIVGNK